MEKCKKCFCLLVFVWEPHYQEWPPNRSYYLPWTLIILRRWGGQLSGVLGISNLAQENKTIAQPFVLWEQVFQMVNKEQQHVPLLMVHLFIFPWIFTCWPFSEFYIFITGTCSHSLTTAPLLLSIISVLILISLS